MVDADDVRREAAPLPRVEERFVRNHVSYRVGQYVFLAVSGDETSLGFAFPKEERAALVAAEPAKFFLPRTSDLRFNWVVAWLAALDREELHEIVLDAWRMVVPKRVAAAYLGEAQPGPGGPR
jgi:hypothetical protein